MYWIISDGFGYSYGLIDKNNPAPENTIIVDAQGELNNMIEAAEREVINNLENFADLEPVGLLREPVSMNTPLEVDSELPEPRR